MNYLKKRYENFSKRYENKPIILTTNAVFEEWNQVFPSAASVTTIVDRLVHHSVITGIDAESWRLKEAREDEAQRASSQTVTEGRK